MTFPTAGGWRAAPAKPHRTPVRLLTGALAIFAVSFALPAWTQQPQVFIERSSGILLNKKDLPSLPIPWWALVPGDQILAGPDGARLRISAAGGVVLASGSQLKVEREGTRLALRLISGEMEWSLSDPSQVALWAGPDLLRPRAGENGGASIHGPDRAIPPRSRQQPKPALPPTEPPARSPSASCEGAVQALPPRARCRAWPY